MTDLDKLREDFKYAIGGLSDKRKDIAWTYVKALEVAFQRKQAELNDLATILAEQK